MRQWRRPRTYGEQEEIYTVVSNLTRVAKKYLFLSFPLGEEKQGALFGNPHEVHRVTLYAPDAGNLAEHLRKFGTVWWYHYARPPTALKIFKPNCIMLWQREGI